jgi:D-3-phosphoglycerate dehydrogenase
MARFLITDNDFPDLELERALFREAGLEVKAAQCRTEQDVIREAEGCQGLLVQYARVGAGVFAARPEIRIASRYGAGFDTIDTEAARACGVWVANSPDYGVGEVATHALGMALALVRHLALYDRDVKAGRWHYTTPGAIRRCSGLTLGILGLGRIGKRMAHVARDSFARVIACDPYLIDGDFPAYVGRVSLEDLFRQSDVASLHVPLNGETLGMVNARLLALMKPGAMLVNTARGAVVNVEDLVAALAHGKLDGAALDVLPEEPPPAGHALLSHPRVILSPHAAFYSVEAERELRQKAAQNLVDWARTGRPTYCVVEGRPSAGSIQSPVIPA